MDIPRMFYRCWEALMSLLEFLGYFDDNSEQSQLSSAPSRTTSGELYDNGRPDSPLSLLSLSLDAQNGQSNFSSLDIGNALLHNSVPEINDLYHDHELSTSPVDTVLLLNHIVQPPIPLSPAFRFPSLLVPPSKSITDFSTEMLLEIFRHLAVIDASDEETASPLVLQCIRLVCRRWGAIVDDHCCGRFLTATPGFLVQDREDGLPTWSRRFDAWCKLTDTGSALDLVSFHLSNRFASSWHILNVDHARVFTGALMKCKMARIVIDLTEAELSEDVFAGTTLPVIPLRDFSWTSEHMGIRHILPKVYGFPWLTLWQDLPWQQLTHVDLNCPLSIWDAHHILAYGTNLTDARLATLKLTDNPSQDGFPLFHPAATSLLRSLTIRSQLDLHLLFSNLELPKLTYFALSIVHPHSSLGLFFKDSRENFLDLALNVPWARIEELDISYESGQTCDITPILANCCRLRRLALAGELTVRRVPNFVGCLDVVTLGAGDFHDGFFEFLGKTTVRRLQITSGSSFVRLGCIKAVEHLSVVNAIDLELLLTILTAVGRSLCVGKFHVVLRNPMTHTTVTLGELSRLDITTNEGIIQFVGATLKSRVRSAHKPFIISVHDNDPFPP